ncbi:AraC family transcriptional regulator [Vibrio chagasii]|nr:AraC family transcriptional regulator [Vibrio chagasii]CAH6951785.1 AraC family transcriptional regulator [Vibrio chagasii]CAH6957816.1 AraC family transcriptional regulator [Vibrio chagasii]CAH6993104.1 AraC family transcriptional regulator [Vibrio chagasii]CAH7196500.1 AraC family transcriptional regulator [Vibrio chagasii]
MKLINKIMDGIINLDDYQVMVKHHESHYSGEVHTHDYPHLVFIHEGCQIISTDKDSLLSMPGSLIYIPAGVPHRADYLKQSHVSLLRLPQASTPNITEICMLDVSPIVAQLFSVWENGGPAQKLTTHYVYVLVDQCNLCKPTNNPLIAKGGMDRRLLMVIEALSNKPNIKMSISDLSNQTGASVRTLNRLFLASFKTSFREIRQKVVMDRAEKMMAKGISATDIAFELEYSSLSAFSTAFKEHQKKSPQN